MKEQQLSLVLEPQASDDHTAPVTRFLRKFADQLRERGVDKGDIFERSTEAVLFFQESNARAVRRLLRDQAADHGIDWHNATLKSYEPEAQPCVIVESRTSNVDSVPDLEKYWRKLSTQLDALGVHHKHVSSRGNRLVFELNQENKMAAGTLLAEQAEQSGLNSSAAALDQYGDITGIPADSLMGDQDSEVRLCSS